MLNPYQRHVMAGYLSNMANRFHRESPEAHGVVEWLTENADLPGLDRRSLELESESFDSKERMSAKQWRVCRRMLDDVVKDTAATRPDRLTRRLRRLGRVIRLSAEEISILQFLLRYQTQPEFEDLFDTVANGRHRRFHRSVLNLKSRLPSSALGVSASTLRRRLATDAPLVRSGLVYVDDDQDISSLERLRLLVWEGDRHMDIRKLLLGATRSTALEWSDFDHLGQNRNDVESLLLGARDSGKKGVNVLIHGSPGTGKTEFCRVLAKRMGAELFSVGEADAAGGEPTRTERLSELRLAQSLLGRDHGSLLLFDEMDDLLSEGAMDLALFFRPRRRRSRGGMSKVFMNRLLEDNATPTLWTTNEVYDMSPAILRRMIFALEMRLPPPRIRARIWARQLAQHDIEATEADTLTLAHEFDAPPGVAAGATAAADLGAGGFDLVRRSVRSLSRVLGCERAEGLQSTDFDPALMEADLDLTDLADRLEHSSERRFSICLQGQPGTGKSAYARYLADRLGLEVMHRRASDLMSMWVGGTERNIAGAFAEARDIEAFLIFDEADSLLADRRGAHRSWEVAQVNEMLTWMESHPLPFVCTTNDGERLDSASLRRFVFKAKLGFLKPESGAVAFRTFFGLEAPPSLRSAVLLTPGDFAVVLRKAEVLGSLSDGEVLVEMLRAECSVKPQYTASIGFGQ